MKCAWVCDTGILVSSLQNVSIFKVVTVLHEAFSPEANLVTKICVQVLYLRKNSERHSREMGKIHGKEKEVSAEYTLEQVMIVGIRSSVSPETSWG